MNFSLTRASLIAEADLVGIAGERAVCDPRGVLFFLSSGCWRSPICIWKKGRRWRGAAR